MSDKLDIGVVCYKLQGVGPRNRTKNLVQGIAKYTDHRVHLITADDYIFENDNVKVYPLNIRSIGKIKKILKNADVVHVPVNVYQAIFVRSIYKGPLVVGTGIQYDALHRAMLKKFVNPEYVIELNRQSMIVCRKLGLDSNYIYPAIDVEKFRPFPEEEIARIKESLGIPLNSKVILFVGKLNKFKGFDIFYRLVLELNRKMKHKFFFLVIGEGELKYLVDNANLDNVLVLGFQKNDDLSIYYNIADVTIVPSISESFSFVALESAACGTPVITTAKGAIEWIFKEKNIYIWANREINDIIKKLENLLEDSSLYRKQIGKALDFIRREGLTLDMFVKKHIDIYKSAIEKFYKN